jgi:hypothetical protein
LAVFPNLPNAIIKHGTLDCWSTHGLDDKLVFDSFVRGTEVHLYILILVTTRSGLTRRMRPQLMTEIRVFGLTVERTRRILSKILLWWKNV